MRCLSQIAVEGCCHGELDNIYASLALTEQRQGVKVDLLLICGDFQAVRNASDLAGMAVPQKYRAMQTFYKYYSGEKLAPVLTIFIGGNHEASAYLAELPYGGWVAPNIYYLGFAGVISVGGVRIGGLTGIYNARHYHTGHYERPPFSDDDMRSFYHVRSLDVLRLLQLRRPLDVFLSHDWPQHIAKHGNTPDLLRRKGFLASEIADGSLGSPPAREVLEQLKPRYWFAAHLHVKFAAAVHHLPPAEGVTRFLSLDKCLPNRDFLQLLRLEGDGSPVQISYDLEWLAVLRSTSHLQSSVRGRLPLDPALVAAASGGRDCFTPTDEEESAVRARCPEGSLAVPTNFVPTAPAYRTGESAVGRQLEMQGENPQTAAFVAAFGLDPNFRTQRGATLDAGRRPAPAPAPVLGGVGMPAAAVPPASAAESQGLLAPLPMPLMDEEIELDDD